MKFFVDTAEVSEIKALIPTGLVDGVTTNPSLVAKSGRDFREMIAEVCEKHSAAFLRAVMSSNVSTQPPPVMMWSAAAMMRPSAISVEALVVLPWAIAAKRSRTNWAGSPENVPALFR